MKFYKDLVAIYGSPLYIYDLHKITTAYKRLKVIYRIVVRYFIH